MIKYHENLTQGSKDGGSIAKMTMRDFFAAFAVVGQLAACADNLIDDFSDEESLAKVAFKIADAMLKARAA